MSVNLDDVRYMANLARLQLTDKEAEGLVHDMNNILDYMTLLGEVDTSNVAPLEHVTDAGAGLRPDKAHPPLEHDKALKNAPDADSDYFRVPRVID